MTRAEEIESKVGQCKQKINASIPAASVQDPQALIIAATHVRQQRKAEWITSVTAGTRTASRHPSRLNQEEDLAIAVEERAHVPLPEGFFIFVIERSEITF
jgi:hypothetical protein